MPELGSYRADLLHRGRDFEALSVEGRTVVDGEAVSVSGSTAVVGAIFEGGTTDSVGAVYVYDLPGGSWVDSKLLSGDRQPFGSFGASLALTGATAFVGAAFFGWDAGIPTGAVYAFERVGSAWHETQKLQPTFRSGTSSARPSQRMATSS